MINAQDTARFEVACWTTYDTDSVEFQNTSTSNCATPLAFMWNFDDPASGAADTSSLANPKHLFTSAGTYNVELIVVWGCAPNDTINNMVLVSAGTTPDFTFTENCPCNNLTFTATGSATGYSWNFGDGTSASGSTINHDFKYPEANKVQVTAIISPGCTTTVSKKIDVCSGESMYFPSKSNNNWVTAEDGYNLDFSTGTPVTNSISSGITNNYNCATMSDPITGDLLFYASGEGKIYDSNYTEIQASLFSYPPETSNLLGYGGVLITPFPGNKNKYYVFYQELLAPGSFAFRYSIVDMTLRGGLGDVEPATQGTFLTNTNGTAISSTVRKIGVCDAEYWLTIPTGDNEITTYLIGSTGISLHNVQTFTNISFLSTEPRTSAFSPSGLKYGFTRLTGSFIFDFNTATGIFSNAQEIRRGSYGIAFSENDKILYIGYWIGAWNSRRVYQYRLDVPNINASARSIGSVARGSCNFWHGDDGKIYATSWRTDEWGIISNPNSYGAGVIFFGNGSLALDVSDGTVGMQNIVKLTVAIIDSINANFTADTTNCLSVQLTNTSDTTNYTDACSFLYNYDTLNYFWDFGDGDTSIQKNPMHTYPIQGTYNVKLIVNRPLFCVTDTIIKTINVIPTGTASIEVSDIAICDGDSIFLNGSFQYNTATFIDTFVATGGCDSIIITNLLIDTIQIITNNTIAICSGDSIFLNGSFQYNSGIYTDTLNAVSGCDSISITNLIFSTFPKITNTTIVNDFCEKNIGSIDVLVSGGTPPFSYNWSNGATTEDLNNLAKGSYILIINDINNCAFDTAIATVNDTGTDCQSYIFIPNAFSPNGDGSNDLLTINGQGIKTIVFNIYDRWGKNIFSTESINQGWNGMNKRGELLNKGVYVYQISGTFINDDEFIKKGNVTLLR